MSAALMILPVVWAYAESASSPGVPAGPAAGPVSYGGSIARAAERQFAPGQRKAPHALRLVETRPVETHRIETHRIETCRIETRPVETCRIEAVPGPVAMAASAGPASAAEAKHAPRAAPIAEVAFYRKYTEALLRRYVKLSMEAGRVPSLLGQEMFRGKVTSYKVRSFEDVVIFTHDVGKCLDLLEPAERALIRRIAMQGHTQGEAATLLGISLRTVVRRYADAVDALTRIFLERKLLEMQP